uniref:Uncharacterized protein n=1 Tax=Caenorhabditis japonica TaxID=281687 RepID=A0A8R1E458_CAEJA
MPKITEAETETEIKIFICGIRKRKRKRLKKRKRNFAETEIETACCVETKLFQHFFLHFHTIPQKLILLTAFSAFGCSLLLLRPSVPRSLSSVLQDSNWTHSAHFPSRLRGRLPSLPGAPLVPCVAANQ